MKDSQVDDQNLNPKYISKLKQNHWTQVGIPRTGSTLQYQILCLGMFMRLRRTSEEGKLHCSISQAAKNGVYKSHDYEHASFLEKERSVLFYSLQTERDYQFVQSARKAGYSVGIVTYINNVAKLGFRTLYQYQRFLMLSDDEINDMAEYLRYWSILRQCCGTQMSYARRVQLLGESKVNFSRYARHVDTHSLWYSACENYDINDMEKSFLHTKVVQHVLKVGLKDRTLLTPSNMDPPLDGGYCLRYNQAVKALNLDFNQQIPTGFKGNNA